MSSPQTLATMPQDTWGTTTGFGDLTNGFVQTSQYPERHWGFTVGSPSQLTGPEEVYVWSRPFQGIGTNAGNWAIAYQIAQVGRVTPQGSPLSLNQVFTFTYNGTLIASGTAYTMDKAGMAAISPSPGAPLTCNVGPYTFYDGITPSVIDYTSTTISVTVPWTGSGGGHTVPFILISTSVPKLTTLSITNGSSFSEAADVYST